MSNVEQLPLAIVDSQGQQRATLTIALLPNNRTASALLDLRGDLAVNPELEPVQLLEGIEYRYTVTGVAGPISIEPDETFYPDDQSGLAGRIKPRQHTGTMRVVFRQGESELGRVAFEVRSRKLDYLSHYRWMVRDVAESCAEIIMARFAPTEQRFKLDEIRDAATHYQRFAFLRSLIDGDAFAAAMQQIISRPHRDWQVVEELRPPGRSLRATSHAMRQLAAPGPRVPWTLPGAPLASLPAQMRHQRTEETVDTPPNRFVKFALTHWRDVVAELGERMSGQGKPGERASAPVERGGREVQAVLARLDELLANDLFTEVGDLRYIPAGSQVLHKRPGYRDLFRAYAQFEAAAALTWQGGEDVYGAGQRDVATLYEYWVFLQLADVVAGFCQVEFDRSALFDVQPGGVEMGLRRGRPCLLEGVVVRHGRRLRLKLWFNRTFSARTGEAWSRPMRPDCSLEIAADDETDATFEPVWLHFDAKYRVDGVSGLFGAKPVTEEEEAALLDREQRDEGGARRSDLLKMHAYRDAIRRSAGAYVIYPGTEQEDCWRYHEILPGLGAFALRPEEAGDASGGAALHEFLDDVLDHVASQGSQHERGRFWLREVYQPETEVASRVPATPLLQHPPADTVVLLGYVGGPEQWAWIRAQGLYNLRAVGRGQVSLGFKGLAAELVVLYGGGSQAEVWEVAGEPVLKTKQELVDSGYVRPSVDLYYCLPVRQVAWPLPAGVTRKRVEGLRERAGVGPGYPVATTWLELLR